MNTLVKTSLAAALAVVANNAIADQVFNDDLIVTSSACIGQDCVNGESFGFDTIRLKENNLRIKFQDTSNSASFPSNDWQLTANDSSNGGLNKFSIDDIDGGKTPFTIEAGAQSHAIYVDDGGRVGLGTSTPVVELQVVDGDSPTLRLEQDGSSGFTAQTWDIAGNETNFFVRDVTNGSKLPFKIKPNAPTNSLFVDSNGDIGLGTQSPKADLHVLTDNTNSFLVGANETDYNLIVKNDGVTHLQSDYIDTDSTSCGGLDCGRFTAIATIEENNSATTGRTLLALKNNAPGWISMEDTTQNNKWILSNGGGSFSVVLLDQNTNTMSVPFKIANNGDVTVSGVVNESSSKLLKENISEVDYNDILSSIDKLAISSWSYIKDKGSVKHIGPMAQDFFNAFNLGASDKHLSSVDTSGVSLAAVKALYKISQEKDKKIEELESRLAKLEAAKR
ncbi:tail fiber domain-containing protein [Shewanella maritima]|uniref:Tail fiber domain-containing protein n=1 Tax=Shewanella maritima TaxID=2520507 RepID=A0A411PE97_9GAMM|nr:tail fiber domain-containing protein [Shewanella maritima]QBF81861.1 tail fiber domain-containing protein [Shewanella maritima]